MLQHVSTFLIGHYQNERIFICSCLRTRMELQFHPGPARKLSTNVYDMFQCRVNSE